MENNNKTILILLSVITVPGFALNADAASWSVKPSIAMTETYTDNVNLDASSQQSDFVTQLSPHIAITGNGSRLNASLMYGANYFYYPGDDNDKHDLRHNLQASGSSELISETFFVEASASINQQFLDRRRALSSVDVSRTENRRTVQAYQVSPYLVHRFGSWATAQLKYNLRHVRSSADPRQTTADTFFGNSLSHLGSFSLNSGIRFTRFTWALLAQYQTEERENSSDFETTTVRADLSYQINRIFTLLGSIGYQDRMAAGSFANFKGIIWDAGFRLVPGPRTSISFRYGNQNDGETYSLNARYKISSEHVLSLSYSDTIQTFQSFVFEDSSGVNADPFLGGDFVSGDITRRKKWALSLGGTRGRTTYSASAFYSKNESDRSALDEKRYGGAVSITRNLNSRLYVGGVFSYNLSKFASDNLNDKFWSASANMNYNISKSLVGTLAYIHSDRTQARTALFNGGSNYISLSIRAAL